MARPRKPSAILELNGTFKNTPARAAARVNEPKPTKGIGPPPDYLNEAQLSCWNEIVGDCHEGVLSQADRIMLEQGSRVLARLRATNWGLDVSVAEFTALTTKLEKMLQTFGMTPADRSRVQVPKSNNAGKDALDEFARAA